MPAKSGIAAFPVAILSLLLPCLLMAGQELATLIIENDLGERVYSVRVNPESGFAIRYTHSVALTPVTDYFLVSAGNIMLDKTIYRDFGAGLPHAPEGAQSMRTEGGQIIISGFNRVLPEFTVRVGRIAGHELLLPSQNGQTKSVRLDSLAKAGSPLTFRIARESHP